MRIWLLSAAGALASLALWEQLPSLFYLPLAALPALAPWRYSRATTHALSGLAVGFIWATLSGHAMLAQRLPLALEGHDLLVRGYLSELPRDIELPDGSLLRRFELTLSEARPASGGERLTLKRVRLSWYGGPALLPGERWQLKVRLKRPRSTGSPGVPDREAQYLSRGIAATGYVRDHPCNQRIEGIAVSAWHHRLRHAVGQRLAARQSGASGGLLSALVNGDRRGVSVADRNLLERTGTIHLLAISGLHITLVAGLFFYLAQGVARLLIYPLHWRPAPIWGALMALAGAGSYAALAGFSLPTQRALVMVSIVIAAQLWRRRASRGVGLCLALLTVLALDPLAGHSASFWLSFIAVGALMLVLEGEFGRLWRFVRAQFAVTLALMLPLGQLLGAVPLISPLANALAIPLVSCLVVPAALLGTATLFLWPPGGELLLRFAELVSTLLLTALGALPTPTWHPPRWSWPVLGMAAIGIVSVLHWQRLLLGGALLLPLLWIPPSADSALRISVLDVGQGLAVLAETKGHALLYDSGPAYRGGYSSARSVILPFLRHRGLRHIDALVISHADRDHAGGTTTLLDSIPITQLWRGEPLPEVASGQACRAGQHWRWDGVDFSFLHPLESGEGNDQSCVLLISTGEHHILLPGDISATIEASLASQLPAPIDVLIAPHHGSGSSSSAALIAATQPSHVVFSRAANNSFGHPNPAVVQRYLAVGSILWDTAMHGTLQFHWPTVQQAMVEVRAFRHQYRRYWHSIAQ